MIRKKFKNVDATFFQIIKIKEKLIGAKLIIKV